MYVNICMCAYTLTQVSSFAGCKYVYVYTHIYIFKYSSNPQGAHPHGVRWLLQGGRLIRSPKLQIILHKRATKYRALLRKMTYKDKGSYESSPPCIRWHPANEQTCVNVYIHIYMYTHIHTCIYTSGKAIRVEQHPANELKCVNVYTHIYICIYLYVHMCVPTQK